MFEGLLSDPLHNKRLMKLLYRAAEWHALAKLRMHTDTTLTLLDDVTIEFGKLMREFRDFTCTEFETVELPREVAARNRREAALIADVQASAASSNAAEAPLSRATMPAVTPKRSSRKKKGLNLSTVKFHFLGDYVRHIRQFGTTDSYSTQLVCLSLNLDATTELTHLKY